MKINIDYTGTIGSGTTAIEVLPETTIKELLTTFHEVTETNDFYTIKGGAPPNRRSMKVGYEYYINNRLVKDLHAAIVTLGLTASDTIALLVDKGRRVD